MHNIFYTAPTLSKSLVLMVMVAVPIVESGTANASANGSDEHALSATLELRFRPTQQMLSRSSVVLDQRGLRIEDLTTGFGHTTITNNALQKYWYVDEHRSMVHEVPMTILDETSNITAVLLQFPGYIDNVPCAGTHGKLDGTVEFKGRMLESWVCSDIASEEYEDEELNLPARQYYSRQYGVVVYSLTHHGLESELVDMKERRVDDSLFIPRSDLRSVSIEEFNGLQRLLDHYDSQAPTD